MKYCLETYSCQCNKSLSSVPKRVSPFHANKRPTLWHHFADFACRSHPRRHDTRQRRNGGLISISSLPVPTKRVDRERGISKRSWSATGPQHILFVCILRAKEKPAHNFPPALACVLPQTLKPLEAQRTRPGLIILGGGRGAVGLTERYRYHQKY